MAWSESFILISSLGLELLGQTVGKRNQREPGRRKNRNNMGLPVSVTGLSW